MIKKNEPKQFSEEAHITNASNLSVKKNNKNNLSRNLNILLLIALIVLGYGYYVKQQELVLIKNPQIQAEVAKKEAKEIITMVKKLVILPEGDESPEVLTINDATLAAKEQPALEGAINGDKVLLYYTAGKAYVYSPSRNIIVNILPFSQQKESIKDSKQDPATTSTEKIDLEDTNESSI